MKKTSDMPNTGPRQGKKPKVWLYAVIFLLLMLLWVVILELFIKPAFLMTTGFPVFRRLLVYLLPPLVLAILGYGIHAWIFQRGEKRRVEEAARAEAVQESQAREERERVAAIETRQRFSLEILAVGLGLEYLRHAQAWEELEGRDRFESILSEDPDDYPGTVEDKERAQREREAEALEPVLAWLNEEWAIPTFLAGPAPGNPMMLPLLESNLTEALETLDGAGRSLRVTGCSYGDDTDRLLHEVFDFMDRNPEVPAVLLVAEDGIVLRHGLRSEDSMDLLADGPRRADEPSEAVAAILLGRKDRLGPMKAFIGVDVRDEDVMKPYWEKEQLSRSAGAFTTTELLPAAWSRTLIDAFLELPVLGHLHRPQYADFSDGMGDGSRAGAFRQTWSDSMAYLGEGGKPGPLLYDAGPVTQGRKLVPLSRGVRELDPDFDAFDMGVNLHRRLGDTGSAAPFMGLALAALAGHREGQPAASVFLRREDGASLFLVRPPEDAERSEPEPEPAHAEA